MHAIKQLLNMIATEAITPDSHMCHCCGRTFSPNEDGCPFCGINANVSLIPELEQKKKKEE